MELVQLRTGGAGMNTYRQIDAMAPVVEVNKEMGEMDQVLFQFFPDLFV